MEIIFNKAQKVEVGYGKLSFSVVGTGLIFQFYNCIDGKVIRNATFTLLDCNVNLFKIFTESNESEKDKVHANIIKPMSLST